MRNILQSIKGLLSGSHVASSGSKMKNDTNHATMVGVALAISGSGTAKLLTSKLRFHTPFTLEEADDVLRQAEAKRDELDKQYAGMVEGIAWFTKHELQPKRPFKSIAFYFDQLKKVQADIERLEMAIDEATRGSEAIISEKMWELAQSMGLKYPTSEAFNE